MSAGIYSILTGIQKHGGLSPEYVAKQIHDVPDFDSIPDRADWIVDRARGKRVLDLGASGALSQKLHAVASRYYGIDTSPSEIPTVQQYDLDAVPGDPFPFSDPALGIELIVAGEVLEHLGNPLYLLERLRATFPGVETIASVPNCFHPGCQRWSARKIENVNRDHVAWYSWYTLENLLLCRAGYELVERHWYNGEPLAAEGLLYVVR